MASDLFRAAIRIALYHPYRNEADLLALLGTPGKDFCFPRVTEGSKVLAFHRIGAVDELTTGFKGIREPAATAPRHLPGDIDLFLVPGVAFSRAGERIGYGGGYYDATLRQRRTDARAVGIGFDLQITDAGFSDPWDTKIDGFVTESGMMFTNTN